MVLADSDRVSRAPPYSGSLSEFLKFRLQGFHLLWLNFPVVFIYLKNLSLREYPAKYSISPTTFYAQQLQSVSYIKFRLLRFRSPLLSESFIYFLFVLLLRCFSSQAFPRSNYVFICRFWGSSLREFPHSESCASFGVLSTPRRFSQTCASFFGFRYQGIPH